MSKKVMIMLGIGMMLTALIPSAFAADYDVNLGIGSGAPGCEETNVCYLPFEITVNVGDTITWFNADSSAHTVTSGAGIPDGNFDSALFMAGNSFEVDFSGYDVGEHPYFCMVHPWMEGLVIVSGDLTGEIQDPPPEPPIVTVPIPDDKDQIIVDLTAENVNLKQQITNLERHIADTSGKINELGHENNDLRNQINDLELEIDSLKDQIVDMTREFLDTVMQLNQWFRDNIS